MDGEVQLFTEPDELLNWLDENDLLMGLDAKEAEVVIAVIIVVYILSFTFYRL